MTDNLLINKYLDLNKTNHISINKTTILASYYLSNLVPVILIHTIQGAAYMFRTQAGVYRLAQHLRVYLSA